MKSNDCLQFAIVPTVPLSVSFGEEIFFSKERLLFNKIGIYLVGRKVVYEYEVIPVVHEVNILSS